MSTSPLEPILAGWASRHGLKLSSLSGSWSEFFCYVAGGPKECFQISTGVLDGEVFAVNAWSVETIDDAELQAAWIVRTDGLEEALVKALAMVEAWAVRPKGEATW